IRLSDRLCGGSAPSRPIRPMPRRPSRRARWSPCSIAVDAPTDRVWALAGDPANLTGLDDGLAIEPDPETPTAGLHARYRLLLRVGPTPIGADVEIVEFAPGRELAWTSLTGVGHLVRIADTTHRDGADEPLDELRGALALPHVHVRVDLTGMQRVHADAGCRQLLRGGLRHAPHRPLTGRVRGQVGRPHEPGE